MTKKLKTGIIGLQHLHPRQYMPMLKCSDKLEVTAVAEERDDLRKSFAADFSLKDYKSWEKMINQEKFDITLIFFPHKHCPEAAIASAEKGINIIVEKPVAASSDDAQKIVDTAKKHNVLFTTPYLWRYHPVSREIKKFIDNGMLGQIVGGEGRCAAGRLERYIKGNSSWMFKKELSGGGPMYNLGVHWIDLFQWLMNSDVKEAVGKNIHINKEIDIEDNSYALITFKNEVVVALDISYTVPESYPNGRDLFIGLRGTKGVISWTPAFGSNKEELFLCDDKAGYRKLDIELKPVEGYGGITGLEFIDDFCDSITEGKSVVIRPEDAVKVLKVAEGIYNSDKEGKSVRVE
jgi:predicted dehydrogenase